MEETIKIYAVDNIQSNIFWVGQLRSKKRRGRSFTRRKRQSLKNFKKQHPLYQKRILDINKIDKIVNLTKTNWPSDLKNYFYSDTMFITDQPCISFLKKQN